MSLPVVTLNGRLTADPELRYTQAGKAVCSYTVAMDKSKQDEGGEWKKLHELFVRCQAWGAKGEALAGVLVKGSPVLVVGELYQEKYETKEGEKRQSLELNVFDAAPIVQVSKQGSAAQSGDWSQPQTDAWATATPGGSGEEVPF